jgi:asparagine synthase (glutamine-hydrolysing)
MCGIAGIWHPDGQPVEEGLLRQMIRRLRHRGPDDSGVYLAGGVGLAHARLEIVDLAGGHQPMSDADGTLWVSFNGEIFNHVELREALEQKGHRFRTRSDTEVLLHMYQEEGEDCVRALNGQWAFALWDAARRRLFLSRDRLGVRPLFHARVGQGLVFASEIKALFAHPEVSRAPDPEALDQVFTFWFAAPPRTFFRGVRQLPPGSSMTLEAGETRVRRYWQPEFGEVRAGAGSAEACAEELAALLEDATRIRLRADVPVGAYLSGGLDSTVVAALARRLGQGPLKTFSVTFEHPELDESRYQQEAVALLQTEHQAVACTAQDIGREFPQVVWHTEAPVLRTAPAPLYRLSRLVRQQGFKVVLTGEGADEVLGGYDIYKEAKIRRFWAARPESRSRPLLLRRLYPYLRSLQAQPEAYRRAFFRVRAEDLPSPFFSHLPRWELTARLKLFFSAELRAELGAYDACAELAAALPPGFARWPPFGQAQWLETTGLLPGYILSSQGDRMAMAHSVEGRFPFLDYRVVEFAAGLPSRWKMRALNEKYLLKRSLGALVPPAIRARTKQPYRAPDAASFFCPETGEPRGEYVADLLSPAGIRRHGLFEPEAVQHLVRKARAGQVTGVRDNMAVVGILSAQLVMEQTRGPLEESVRHGSTCAASDGH